MELQELVERHLGLSLRRQMDLTRHLGQHTWSVDLGKGTIDFGKSGFFSKRREYKVQLLGSESDLSATWLWAWANEGLDAAPSTLVDVQSIRAFGQKHGIEELTTATLDLDVCPGELLAPICRAIVDADAYYRGPYANGSAWFLLRESPIAKAPLASATDVSLVLQQGITLIEMDHRNFARAYLRDEEFVVDQSSDRMIARAQGRGTLNLTFDSLGRISSIEASP